MRNNQAYVNTGAQARAPLGGRPVDVENDIVNFYYSKFEKMILSNLQIFESLCFDLYSQFDGLEMFKRDLEIFSKILDVRLGKNETN